MGHRAPPRVCIDLTPNETIDRHGGIGRYGYYLLEQLLELPEVRSGEIELCALPVSNERVMAAEQALERAVLARQPLRLKSHRRHRRFLAGSELRRAGIDLFHATQPVALPLLPTCKVVCSIYDLVPIVYPRPFRTRVKTEYHRVREKLEWSARLARVDHLVAISDWTANDLVSTLGVPRSKISTIHLGVDTRLFNTERSEDEKVIRKYDLPERGFVCVSSDHYRKNHRVLFDAWRREAGHIPEGLVFVGHAMYGTTLNEIHSEVQRSGLAARFRWLRNVDDHELPAIYRWAQATIAPSLYEGFGMTLIESMACGTPVAVARNGVYEEVAGSAGMLFDGRSVEELGHVLRTLSRDAVLRQTLIQHGFERARRFTWRRTAESTLAVYQRLLTPAPETLPHPPFQIT